MTDYHAECRDAVRDTLKAALLTDYSSLSDKTVSLDDLEGSLRNVSFPCVVCACVGPEQNRPEMSTNVQDGVGYPILVGLFTAGAVGGEKSPEVPDMTTFRRTIRTSEVPDMTTFRRTIRTSFNNKRLSGVSQVGWCEVSDSGPIFDPKDPNFQRLTTAMVVNCIGRWPRS